MANVFAMERSLRKVRKIHYSTCFLHPAFRREMMLPMAVSHGVVCVRDDVVHAQEAA